MAILLQLLALTIALSPQYVLERITSLISGKPIDEGTDYAQHPDGSPMTRSMETFLAGSKM